MWSKQDEKLAMDAAVQVGFHVGMMLTVNAEQAYRHSNIAKGIQRIIIGQERTKDCNTCGNFNCVNPNIVEQYEIEHNIRDYPPDSDELTVCKPRK